VARRRRPCTRTRTRQTVGPRGRGHGGWRRAVRRARGGVVYMLIPGNDVRPATASAAVVVVVAVAVVVTAVRRARIFKKAPARALYRTHRVASSSTYIHYYARRTHTRRARTRNGLGGGGGKSGAPESFWAAGRHWCRGAGGEPF